LLLAVAITSLRRAIRILRKERRGVRTHLSLALPISKDKTEEESIRIISVKAAMVLPEVISRLSKSTDQLM